VWSKTNPPSALAGQHSFCLEQTDTDAALPQGFSFTRHRAHRRRAGAPERWALAGDQLFADLDLSAANLPAGSRLRIGEATVEISAEPHTGCAKFKARFGAAALAFVNSPTGRDLRLRGVNARIITAGTIRVGDPVVRLCRD
jgi:hypothetical protein